MKYLQRIADTCSNIACNCVPWCVENGKPVHLPPNFNIVNWFKSKEMADVMFVPNGDKVGDWQELLQFLHPHSKVYVIYKGHERSNFLGRLLNQHLALIDERLVDGNLHFVFRPPRHFDRPEWNWQKGATILVHSGGGFGDDFHAGRYAHNLKKICKFVIFEARPETHRLLSECSSYDRVVMKGEDVDYDFHVPIRNLVHHYGREPLVFPYFKQPQGKVELSGKLKIGFAYRGHFVKYGTCRVYDVNEFEMFHGASLYHIQKDQNYESAGMPDGNFVDLSGSISDWYDTACYISQMDYVISPDTSLAHLSAAMGKQTRVFAERHHQNFYIKYPKETSPSYPSVLKVYWGKDALRQVAKEVLKDRMFL